MGDLIKAANKRWGSGLRERAAKVSVSGTKTGFRDDWRPDDPSYATSRGVQEVSFKTLASDSTTDRRFSKPYNTVYRFPLNPATGEPYPPGTGTNDLPVWVSCSCPSFQYYCEVALKREGNSDKIHSDGSFPRVNNPSMEPIVCKHIIATSNAAMQRRKTIAVTAAVTGEDPAEVKDRDPSKGGLREGSATRRRTPKEPLTAAKHQSLPQTWMGRLMYILFNERRTR